MFRLQPLARPVDLQPVLSINTCIGLCGACAAWITGKFAARRLTVV
jgi:hypothetical protein